MRILDIDLDIFVDPRPDGPAHGDRLESSMYEAWSVESVERYLVNQCNLRKDSPIPGAVVTCHHELFSLWDSLISRETLVPPFHFTHIDSHADLGMGFPDSSSLYIMGDLLHRSLSARRNPKRGGTQGLLEGNFVSFTIACQWISEIEYVHHPQLFEMNGGLPDIPDVLFRNNDPTCGVLQFKKLPSECLSDIYRRLEEFDPISLEPEVPIAFTPRDEYTTDAPFDFVFLACSPKYTPPTADPIIECIGQFISKI